MTFQVHVRDSIHRINSETWSLGHRAIISRSPTASEQTLWEDEEGYYYNVSECSEATPEPQPINNTADPSPFQLVYDAGDAHVVWKVGNAFIKVNIIAHPKATREHVTINAVKATSPAFAIPDVLYHGEWDGRYYLITSALPGKTLVEVWPDIDEDTKCHYVDQAVKIITELAEHRADYIGGVDGGELSDQHFGRFDEKQDLSHNGLLEVCTELGMESSTFLFYHCDMGPGNLIVGPDGCIGVIDWETAGFVPKEWIRTKFRISSGLDLDSDYIEREEEGQWRERMQKLLGIEGYPEVAAEWIASRGREFESII